MSGLGSRARRVEANNRAKLDVYANKGSPMKENPFKDPRQQRIYAKSYNSLMEHYHEMEELIAEMEKVYGSYTFRR